MRTRTYGVSSSVPASSQLSRTRGVTTSVPASTSFTRTRTVSTSVPPEPPPAVFFRKGPAPMGQLIPMADPVLAGGAGI